MFNNMDDITIRKIKSSGLFFTALILFLVCFNIPNVSAHRVTIFAWVEGDTVHTQSKFSGGKKAQDSLVEVFDAKGNKLLQGKTDSNGEFSFKLPKKTDLTIVIQAGSGHRGQWQLSAEDINEALGDQVAPISRTDESKENVENSSKANENDQVEEIQDGTVIIKASELQRRIDTSLDRKLAPIMTALAEVNDPGPDIRDIISGIGYILGLVGIGLYVSNRREEN
jgi:nickel transport protein